jgi:hypothetical protein
MAIALYAKFIIREVLYQLSMFNILFFIKLILWFHIAYKVNISTLIGRSLPLYYYLGPVMFPLGTRYP